LNTYSEVEGYFPKSPILSAAETARLMGFRSVKALANCRSAGRLPIEMFRVPGRRGWFAATQDVRMWLSGLLDSKGSVPRIDERCLERLGVEK
jgi:hypothetical protein